jgi:hypothetical protein
MTDTVRKQFNYTMLAPYLGQNSVPTDRETVEANQRIQKEYTKGRTEAFQSFISNCDELERLMREHIAGKNSAA